jgi:hypothetical protein
MVVLNDAVNSLTRKGYATCQILPAITQLPDPSGFSAVAFTDVIRDSARKLIEQAIHAELATLMTPKFDSKTDKCMISLRPNGQKCYNTSAVRRVLAG